MLKTNIYIHTHRSCDGKGLALTAVLPARKEREGISRPWGLSLLPRQLGAGVPLSPGRARRCAHYPRASALAAPVIKTRALVNFTPFTADVASRCPFPPGEDHKGATESTGCDPTGTGGILPFPRGWEAGGSRCREPSKGAAKRCGRVPRPGTCPPRGFLQLSCGHLLGVWGGRKASVSDRKARGFLRCHGGGRSPPRVSLPAVGLSTPVHYRCQSL